jgi:hypothetical protein
MNTRNLPGVKERQARKADNLTVVSEAKLKLNSVVLVRKRTIPTQRPQPADEVSANFS